MTDFTTPHDAETLEALRITRDALRQKLIKATQPMRGQRVDVGAGGTNQVADALAIFVCGYHAANEELRIASAKAARIEAGENYVNETA